MRIRKTTGGYTFLHTLSLLLFVLALAGIVALVGTDLLHQYRVTLLHQHLDAWPLILIGLSYIALQVAEKQSHADRAKGIFLGIAFLFWGTEQLLPPSRLVTFLDEGAVTIFVLDVSVIVWSRLNRRDVP